MPGGRNGRTETPNKHDILTGSRPDGTAFLCVGSLSERKNVLVVTSGGPIATAVGYVLGASAEATIDMNMRIRNSAVTEFQFNPKRHHLLTYNTLPHLDSQAFKDWITYA